MRIGDVNIPSEIVEAHRTGQLVLFVGAGASIAAPSSLPTFRTLTEAIAAEAGVPVAGPLDQFLGVLRKEHNVDVHARVAALIGWADSRPNTLHEAIVALAATSPTPRIVTTNYDTHLSTASAARGLVLNEYLAPALPMGDDFEGIVYLHGRLGQQPRHLVVTDEDFGRAYLRDAWAARFLERMFATYTVLFIGYSHSDLVMMYLGRALRASSVRYSLTDELDGARWPSFRIKPILYRVVDGLHEELVGAVSGWASQASMGLLDHRQRVGDLTTAAPSAVPEEVSYLESILADPGKVKFFVEFARGADWLDWVATRPEFGALFGSADQDSRCTRELAWWFARHFVTDQRLSPIALAAVRRGGGRLGPTLWWAIGQAFHMRSGPRPAWLAPWLILLIRDRPEPATDWLDYALVKSSWPEDRASALLLFDHLTEPVPELSPTFGGTVSTRMNVAVRGDAHWLGEAWTTVFTPRIAEAAEDLVHMAERHLRRARQILVAAGAADARWDPTSFRRSAIEPHPQDRHASALDIVIDVARDCLESLLAAGSPSARILMDRWAASDVPLLRRLAIHGWIVRTDVDATTKLAWLTERLSIYDVRVRHEAFRLVAQTLEHADGDVADSVVAQAVAGPEDAGEHRDYEVFNALVWLTRSAPRLPSARDALDRMRLEHPEWEQRAHPDLTAWTETGIVPSRPPMTIDALHTLIEQNPRAAVAELRKYEGLSAPFDGPTWSDAIGLLTATVNRWPADGLVLLDQPDEVHGIVHGVVRGWSTATVDDSTAAAIVVRLSRLNLGEYADDVARLLEEGGRAEGSPTEWHRLPGARQLAFAVWQTLDSQPPDTDVDDWLTLAINRPAGQLAEFWVHAVAGDWRAAGDSWQTLTDEHRAALDELLGGTDARTAYAEVILASQLGFFFSADPDWTKQRLLPLLAWADPDRARRVWEGFLMWGRPSVALLEAGLLERYLDAVEHVEALRDDHREQLADHLAAVALRTDADAPGATWLRAVTTAADARTRTDWLERVGWQLGRLSGEAVEHQWQRWMRQYWQDRVDSIPTGLTASEGSALSSWVIPLTSPESIRAAVQLATARPAELSSHSGLLDDLDDERIGREPAAMAELVAHLLRHTSPPFYGCYRLESIVASLRARLGPAGVKAIVEQALRLDCHGAADW